MSTIDIVCLVIAVIVMMFVNGTTIYFAYKQGRLDERRDYTLELLMRCRKNEQTERDKKKNKKAN